MTSAPTVGQHNLPEPLTTLIGRDQDRRLVIELIRKQRIVTLLGVGGVGKTRLALEVARTSVVDFADGVWLVELAALSDGALVPAAVATSVGAALDRDRPPLDSLAAALGSQRLMVVLDNCEHLAEACAELVERLARTCPKLHMLATSREPLAVPGEVVWPVQPLEAPALEAALYELRETPAVRLFVDRSRAARPDFALTAENAGDVARICQRLDGLPLALELAAARTGVLSPEQLARRLDDRFKLLVGGARSTPARQQTLEATVAWSYDLLDERDQRLFAQLSVFAGGFSLELAEAVCGLDGAASVLEGLERLANHSMLVARVVDGEQRFSLLETLREFGRERLRERNEHGVMHRRLVTWVRARAEAAEPALRGPEQAWWLRWAEREHDNIRLALEWSIDTGDAESAVGLVGALWWAWLLHDRWIETEEWLDRALNVSYASGGTGSTSARARALHGAGTTAAFRGKYARAQALLDESVALAHELGDAELLLAGESAYALLSQFQGEIDAAQRHVESMLKLAGKLDRPWYAARAAEFIASQALQRGDLSGAATKLSEAVRLARAAGDQWNLAMLLSHLGDVERMRGTHPRAAPLYEESIRLFERLGLPADPSRVHNLAYVALAERQAGRAESLFSEALAAFRHLGDPRGVADCVIGLGCVRAAERRPSEAARLFGAGDAALAALGSTVWASNQADYQHWLRIARGALGEDAWNAEYTNGGLLGLDGVLEPRSVIDRAAIHRTPRARGAIGELTRREREVAQLAAQGMSNRRIAEVLVIAEKTAANHLQNALDKLDVHSRSQLTARAVELGLAPAARPEGP